jgi:hypothetical protein
VIGIPEIAAIAVCVTAFWFVWNQMKTREIANAAMREACELRGFLFLDDTVSLRSIRPRRDDEGRVHLARFYTFQYSDTGHNRRDGSIALLGAAVTTLALD